MLMLIFGLLYEVNSCSRKYLSKTIAHLIEFRKMASTSTASSAVPRDTRKLIAVCQMTSRNNKEENIKTCSGLINSAKKRNCKMVFLPEACDYIGDSAEETLSLAEPLDGETMKAFCNMAKENEIWLSIGGFHEKVSSEKVQNAHVLIDSAGEIVKVYRKIHLFDVNIPEQKRMMESESVLRGEEIVAPIETPVGNLGLSICYDIRFPELSLTLAKLNAQILTFPSAFTYVTGAAHWEILVRARAIENQCYVVAATQTGVHGEKRVSWGHAMIVDPWGAVVCQCTEGTNISVAEIKIDKLEEVRKSMPIWEHRRADLYGALVLKKPLDTKHTFGNKVIHESCIIWKTEQSLAFMSSCPIVPGHVLVIPVRQVSRFSDLTLKEIGDLFQIARKVQMAFEKWCGYANTLFMKESDHHFHVHLVPRRPNDFPQKDQVYTYLEIHDETSVKPTRTKSGSKTYIGEEVSEIANVLRSHLKTV